MQSLKAYRDYVQPALNSTKHAVNPKNWSAAVRVGVCAGMIFVLIGFFYALDKIPASHHFFVSTIPHAFTNLTFDKALLYFGIPALLGATALGVVLVYIFWVPRKLYLELEGGLEEPKILDENHPQTDVSNNGNIDYSTKTDANAINEKSSSSDSVEDEEGSLPASRLKTKKKPQIKAVTDIVENNVEASAVITSQGNEENIHDRNDENALPSLTNADPSLTDNDPITTSFGDGVNTSSCVEPQEAEEPGDLLESGELNEGTTPRGIDEDVEDPENPVLEGEGEDISSPEIDDVSGPETSDEQGSSRNPLETPIESTKEKLDSGKDGTLKELGSAEDRTPAQSTWWEQASAAISTWWSTKEPKRQEQSVKENGDPHEENGDLKKD